MNDEKLYEVLNNQIQFSNDLMDLNIKYAEEIERLNNTIRKINKILDNQVDYKEDRDIIVAIEEVITSE